MEEEKLVTDASFNTTDVSLRSTCRDRTLHSMQCLLSTLFPVKLASRGGFTSRESLDSHPIIKINSDSTCVLNSTCTHIA